jgi:hypothetical protein
MKSASSLARNAHARAMSIGWLSRPSGMVLMIRARTSALSSPGRKSFKSPVSPMTGLIAFTRM